MPDFDPGFRGQQRRALGNQCLGPGGIVGLDERFEVGPQPVGLGIADNRSRAGTARRRPERNQRIFDRDPG